MASPQEEEAPHPSTAAWLRMAWSGEYGGWDDRWELTCGGSVLNGEYGADLLIAHGSESFLFSTLFRFQANLFSPLQFRFLLLLLRLSSFLLTTLTSLLLGRCAWWLLCCHAPQPGEVVC